MSLPKYLFRKLHVLCSCVSLAEFRGRLCLWRRIILSVMPLTSVQVMCFKNKEPSCSMSLLEGIESSQSCEAVSPSKYLCHILIFLNYHHRCRRFPLETRTFPFFLISKRKMSALRILASAVVTHMRVPALPASLGAARTRSQSQVDWRWLTREIPHSDDTAPWRLGTFSNMAHTPQATCASHCT